MDEACNLAGVSPHTWVRAEHNGEIRPSSARRIADALGVEPGQLMGEPPVPLGHASPSPAQNKERRIYAAVLDIAVQAGNLRRKSAEIIASGEQPEDSVIQSLIAEHNAVVRGFRACGAESLLVRYRMAQIMNLTQDEPPEDYGFTAQQVASEVAFLENVPQEVKDALEAIRWGLWASAVYLRHLAPERAQILELVA
jgi:hypothetical protein